MKILDPLPQTTLASPQDALDLISFNHFEDIIAIKVKGTKDIQKGIRASSNI
ncbi:unnamed protein product [marine sediment metagenome]|uniref:Uncharacterized protein n=1 Tax=marine sediment metagenome TaxID=412755 RepID=X1IE92_9ZZZZ